MKKKIKSPIILIFYNRPKKTKKLLNLIKKINFSKVYIKVDGFKNLKDKKNVDLVCKEVLEFKKKYINKVKVIKENKNIGLQKNILNTIDWVLEREDRFIFLEDDHHPSESFFYFCDKYLELYKNDDRVMQIKGSCFLEKNSHDFYFSKYSDCIGWATWKNSWKKLVKSFNFFEIQKLKLINYFFQSSNVSKWFNQYLYRETITLKSKGLWSTWFQLTLIKYNGLCISPMKNLVVHQGILKNTNSTHYDKSYELITKYKLQNIDLDKLIKKDIKWNKSLDEENFKIVKKTDPIFNIKNRFKWLIKYNLSIRFNKSLSASLKT
tara:strand:+ start:96 stop:1061 length:966 start_codon:yes stop_codon:yes gene_type:complete